jgi:hypothetical protein
MGSNPVNFFSNNYRAAIIINNWGQNSTLRLHIC